VAQLINATITSKNEQVVIQSLQTLDDRLLQACEIGLARGLLLVVATAQLDFLSGPRPAKLQNVTGRLRGGMQSSVKRAGQQVLGRVGNAVKYAAFHEFGFHGTQNVRAHSRVIDQVNAKGQSIQATPGKVLSGVLQTRKNAAKRQTGGFVTVQFVKAHSRQVNYPGKPFTRPALTQNEAQLGVELKKELSLVK
jgi:phage gpG-like protein